jgi:voltage-gated potassium channel
MTSPEPAIRKRRRRRRIAGGDPFLTAGIVLVIAAAVGTERPSLVLLLVLSTATGLLLLRFLVPGGRLLAVTLTNITVIYAAAFVAAERTLFAQVPVAAQYVVFALPMVGFLGGVVLRRGPIGRQIAGAHRSDERLLVRGLRWLGGYGLLGIVTLGLVSQVAAVTAATLILLLGTALQAGWTVLRVREAAQLLIETGLVFRAFARRAAALIVPAFAFVLFYLFLVVMFAAVYTLADRFSAAPGFMAAGRPVHLAFPEALYFSVVTLSTIGYGDITPVAGIMRVLVAAEIVMGLLLLLFGFAEIMRHAQTRRGEAGTRAEE